MGSQALEALQTETAMRSGSPYASKKCVNLHEQYSTSGNNGGLTPKRPNLFLTPRDTVLIETRAAAARGKQPHKSFVVVFLCHPSSFKIVLIHWATKTCPPQNGFGVSFSTCSAGVRV